MTFFPSQPHRRCRPAFAAIVVVLAAAGAVLAQQAPGPSPRVVRFLGPRAAAALGEVKEISASHVTDSRAKEDEPSVGGYFAAATGPGQTEALARAVASVLLDEKSYRFDAPPRRGGFTPQVGLRLWAGKQSLDVLLSPATSEVVVFSPRADDGSVRSAQQQVTPDAMTRLLGEVKSALPPDDPEGLPQSKNKKKKKPRKSDEDDSD